MDEIVYINIEFGFAVKQMSLEVPRDLKQNDECFP